MKIAFDEEVPSEKAEEFMEALTNLRWASALPYTLFAYAAASSVLSATLGSTASKHKYGTMKYAYCLLLKNRKPRFRLHETSTE